MKLWIAILCVICLSTSALQAQEVGSASVPLSQNPVMMSIIAGMVARHAKANDFDIQGDQAMTAHRYSDAESDYRQAIKVMPEWGPSYQRLAESLTQQGRLYDAIDVYRFVVTPSAHWSSTTATEPRTLFRFAIVLSQVGAWGEAVNAYDQACMNLPISSEPQPVIKFDYSKMEPAKLQASAHGFGY